MGDDIRVPIPKSWGSEVGNMEESWASSGKKDRWSIGEEFEGKNVLWVVLELCWFGAEPIHVVVSFVDCEQAVAGPECKEER